MNHTRICIGKLASFLPVLFMGLILGIVVLPETAHAYIDPGAGSYALQVLLAGFFAALYGFKEHVRRFFSWVRSFFSRSNKHG